MAPPARRLEQGLRALFAFAAPLDLGPAHRHLSPPLLALFCQLNRGEQLHSLKVLQGVMAQGPAPDALAAAALLHDVGKSRYPLTVWQKTLVVLTRAVLPRLAHRWSQGNPDTRWHRPYVVYAQHPTWGGEMVSGAGATEEVVWLVAHHADQIDIWADHRLVDLLRRLQMADDRA